MKLDKRGIYTDFILRAFLTEKLILRLVSFYEFRNFLPIIKLRNNFALFTKQNITFFNKPFYIIPNFFLYLAYEPVNKRIDGNVLS